MKFICVDLVLKRFALAVGGTIDRRLYDYLRGAILDGSWHQGGALPASRDLAREAGMSCNTVLHATSNCAQKAMFIRAWAAAPLSRRYAGELADLGARRRRRQCHRCPGATSTSRAGVAKRRVDRTAAVGHLHARSA